MTPTRLRPNFLHRARWFHCLVAVLMLAIGFPSGCSQEDPQRPDFTGKTPLLRVLIFQSLNGVRLTATSPPSIRAAGSSSDQPVDLPASTPVMLSISPTGWQLGSAGLPPGEFTLIPATDGSIAFNSRAYRGRFRFIPRPNGQFDVIDDVDVESYLRGVLAGEMLPNFADETYKAQAVVARTYAIYEKQMHSSASDFDLYADERSMMYGGLSTETPRAIRAQADTRGLVVAYGSPGSERIFKAYFSSCCGGAGQSAADAFGDPDIAPLSALSTGTLCANSPRYSWPPVTISKSDLTHRIVHYATLHSMPEKDMATIASINILSVNNVGRPVLFTITDVRNRRYAIVGEELRRAINTDSTPTTKVWSSYFQIENGPRDIRLVNGHGFGHGVGLCQWCAQRRAELGMQFEQIVTLSYPRSTIVKAY
jgi:stage II sporulation protein D